MGASIKILVVGAGHVGLTFGLACAHRGSEVYFYDLDISRINSLKNSKLDMIDANIEHYFDVALKEKKLNFVSDSDVLDDFDVVVVTIGTGLHEIIGGVEFVARFEHILSRIRNKDFHIMLRSTVSIGTTSRAYSVLKLMYPKVSVSFCPERSVEGNAVDECLNLPQIVGGVDNESENIAIKFFEKHLIKVVKANNSEEAEFCKLIGNVWRDSTFAIANEFSQLASGQNIDIFSAINVVNQDYPRAKIPFPGPVGGPCLTKDTGILIGTEITDVNSNSEFLVEKARKVNYQVIKSLCSYVSKSFVPDQTKIIILGSAFKGRPATLDTRNSPGLDLFNQLHQDYNIKIMDPEKDQLTKDENFKSIHESIDDSNLIILTTNHDFFNSKIFSDAINGITSSKYLIDLWPNDRNWEINNSRIILINYKDWHSFHE
jgi:UDP-N-acetyl-D-mannosaminuronic acid dehydrogenase